MIPHAFRAAICATLAGCTGLIEDPGATSGSDVPSGAWGNPDDGSSSGPPPLVIPAECGASDAAAGEPLRRLTTAEYRATLQHIFGAAATTAISHWLDAFPRDDEVDVRGSIPNTYDDAHLTNMVLGSFELGGLVGDPASEVHGVLPSCARAALSDDELAPACLDEVLGALGPMIHRRPLSAEHRAYYTETVQETERTLDPDVRQHLEMLVSQMLLAPDFLFHMSYPREPGSTVADPYTVANRISYRITGGVPDAELLAAAARDGLSTEAEVRGQAARLLASEASIQRLETMFFDWLQVQHLDAPSRAVVGHLGLEGVTTPEAYRRSLASFIRRKVIDEGASLRSLFVDELAPNPDDPLAALLAIGGPRSGLLTHPALLVHPITRTSPIVRGAHLLQNVLCQGLGEIPADADQIAAEAVADLDRETTSAREIADLMTQGSPCSTCHSLINPTGHVFEAFGPAGERRTSEAVFDDTGTHLRDLPIDTAVDNVSVLQSPVADHDEMSRLIAADPRAHACAISSVYEFTHRRQMDAAETCAIAELGQRSVEEDRPFRDFLLDVLIAPQIMSHRLPEGE